MPIVRHLTLVLSVAAILMAIGCVAQPEPTPTSTTPLPTATPLPTIPPTPTTVPEPRHTPTYEDKVVADMVEEFDRVPDSEQGDAFMGILLVGAELCQRPDNTTVASPVRAEAFQKFQNTMLEYEAKANRSGKHISYYRPILFEEAIRMAVQCGMKVDISK